MAIFTIDRTINFDETKTKKVLSYVKKGYTDSEIEDHMMRENIVRARESGFFRRRWGTYLKEFGLYHDNKLSELGNMYESEELSTKELLLLMLVKRTQRLENDQLIRPLELIIKVQKEMLSTGHDHALSFSEFEKILSKASSIDESEISEIAQKIINNRSANYDYSLDESPAPCHPDIWKNLLITSGLGLEEKNIKLDLDLQIIDFILNFYDELSPNEELYYIFNDDFVEYIRFPIKTESEEMSEVRKNYKEYYPSIIYNYLFNMSINDIEKLILQKSENANIPYKILNGFGISTSKYDKPSNMKLYNIFKGYEGIVVNKLKNTDDIYNNIAQNIIIYTNSSDESESILERFKKFYSEKKYDFWIPEADIDETISKREDFQKEYSIEKLKNLDVDDYVLGTDNFKNSLSYSLEFGKYAKVGMGIGGGSAFKHGIFYREDGYVALARDGKKIDDIEAYWNEFIKELVSCLLEYGTMDSSFYVQEKYKLLKGMPQVLTKMAYLYYPNKFINIASREKLLQLFDLFDYEYDKKLTADQLSFVFNKNIRRDFPELEKDDPELLGSALWNFLILIGITDEEETEEGKDDVITEEIIDYDSYTKDDFLNEVFIEASQYDRIKGLLEKKKNIILEGPPGVGKTFMAKRLAYSLMGFKNTNHILPIQFHQSYSYEDFIEGYRPQTNGNFEVVPGIFTAFCDKAKKDPNNDYYCIIDEINRGNLSKILGELMMLIEADKRGESLKLPYSKKEFSVPKNLYIIGLMNTADRSLALIDYALRRRFSFVTLEPAFSKEKFMETINDFYSDMLDNLFKVIVDMNKFIEEDSSLGKGFEIGHSYFCGLTSGSKEEIENIILYDLIPMIKEYWFDDIDSLSKWESALIGALYE